MAKVIAPGLVPEPPWYLTEQLTCADCGCVFQLEESDFDTRQIGGIDRAADWHVTKPKDMQIMGMCPHCKKSIVLNFRADMIPAPKAAATDRQTETRATLPYGITGWRWMFDKAPRKVAAFPLRGNRLIEVELSGPDRYHAVIRQDGQIRADMTVHRDQIGTRWLSIEEPDAAQLDMELVDFVRALGIGRPLNGGY